MMWLWCFLYWLGVSFLEAEFVVVAVCGVVVDHADGLHVGVDDGGADEGEAAFFEILADFF